MNRSSLSTCTQMVRHTVYKWIHYSKKELDLKKPVTTVFIRLALLHCLSIPLYSCNNRNITFTITELELPTTESEVIFFSFFFQIS